MKAMESLLQIDEVWLPWSHGLDCIPVFVSVQIVCKRSQRDVQWKLVKMQFGKDVHHQDGSTFLRGVCFAALHTSDQEVQ